MNDNKDKSNSLVNTLVAAIPSVNLWIDNYISQHKSSRVRLANAGFSRLPGYFAPQTLESAYYVLVPTIDALPLAEFGLGELSFEGENYNGITFKDTFFVTSKNESLHFHEMIHVIQWNEMGPENFLLDYGIGLVKYGYRDSPLEEIAYSMQAQFDAGKYIEDLELTVRSHCRKLLQQMG